MTNTHKKRIAVIGGGASGIMAAIFARRNGADVTIFEEKDTLCKKINATGNGRCNFTNAHIFPEAYRGNRPSFVKPALEAFTNMDLVSFFNSIGILTKEKKGYFYPYSENASAVSKTLSLYAVSLGVKVNYEKVSSVKISGQGFLVNSQYFDSTIICCGSFANMNEGNRNSFEGYDIAKGLTHKVTPLFPSLVQIRCAEKFFKTINGVRIEGNIKLFADGNMITEDTGELLFTEHGISGIPAFQISRFCGALISENKKVRAVIDFFPGMSEEDLTNYILKLGKSGFTCEEALYGLFNYKLNYVLLNECGLNVTQSSTMVLDAQASSKLAHIYKNFTCTVTGTNDFSFAQVVAGGVDTTDVDENTMESKLVKGLYFAGEILDVDGICGGYNLQWAFSSGKLAGENAAKV